MVFSFNDVEALDSGLVFYVFYVSLLGIWWDPLPPKRYDVGLSMGLHSFGAFLPRLAVFLGRLACDSDHFCVVGAGTSWFLFAMIQEIGWSGSLFPGMYLPIKN